MTLNSNQFMQSVEAGFCDRNTCAFNPIPVVVDANQSTAIGDGVAVSLADVATPISQVVASAVDGGTTATGVFGMTFYTTHNLAKQKSAGARIEILPLNSGAIIYLTASEAITAGNQVSQIVSSGKIQVADAGEEVIGQALISAGADGDIIPVILNNPVGTVVPTPST